MWVLYHVLQILYVHILLKTSVCCVVLTSVQALFLCCTQIVQHRDLHVHVVYCYLTPQTLIATLDDYDPDIHKSGYMEKFPNFQLLPPNLQVGLLSIEAIIQVTPVHVNMYI